MIDKQDIRDRAAEWHLTLEVVEKDYVLGWLLAALGAHQETGSRWAFKGGTCLKKCYVETFRFSEDLDFTLAGDAEYTAEGLRRILSEVAEHAGRESGITFFVPDLSVHERKNRQGQATWEVRLGYRGPLALPGPPKVQFDLTRHEQIVLPTEGRSIFHEYPDTLPGGAVVRCYTFVELLAEKLRALIRSRASARPL